MNRPKCFCTLLYDIQPILFNTNKFPKVISFQVLISTTIYMVLSNYFYLTIVISLHKDK